MKLSSIRIQDKGLAAKRCDLLKVADINKIRVAGLMSGTSADGVDVAIVDFVGSGLKIVAFGTIKFSRRLREDIFRLFDHTKITSADVCHYNFVLGRVFADALMSFCKDSSIPLASIDLIGSHGQTIYHEPAGRKYDKTLVKSTLQIGEPCVIAQQSGILTVADFRTADMAAGGQGAPLVPFTDHILFSHETKSRIIHNIGGIANLTYLPAGGTVDDLIAFDTGPGNMIIDALAYHFSGGKMRYDKNGAMAAKGKVNAKLLNNLMKHRFIRASLPKTTGREDFGSQFTAKLLADAKKSRINGFDLIATATAFTAHSMADAYKRFLSGRVDEIILCGGGCRNPVLVKMLADCYSANIRVMDDLGISADAKEAVSFAILALYTVKGFVNNAPAATGADRKVILGKIALP